MIISNAPVVSIGEKLIQEAAAERRTPEKAVTQVTSGELGLGKEDKGISDKAEDFGASMDSARLSASAMIRYRAASGAKTADDQQRQPRDDESFSHQSYMISEESRKAEWKRRIADARGQTGEATTEEDAAENVREAERKYTSGEDALSVDTDGTEKSQNTGGGGSGGDQQDEVAKVRDKIAQVQRKLTEAQGRLTQAAAKASGSGASGGSAHAAEAPSPGATQHFSDTEHASGAENAPAESSDPTAASQPTAATGAAAQGQANALAAQAEVSATENEVNALGGELLKLYQELMKALKAREQ